HKQLALGRYDGAVVILDEASGKVQAEPLPVKPKPPQLLKLSPDSGPRGRVIRVRFEGKNLAGTTALTSTYLGVTANFLKEDRTQDSAAADVTFPANTPAGVYKIGLKTASGQTAQLSFTVDLFPQVTESGLHDAPHLGQKLTLPVTVVGAIGRPGQVD